jgi:hypothetical protein
MWNDKPDRYPIPVRNPIGIGTNFYLRVWVHVRIFTRSLLVDGRVIVLPDPLPFLPTATKPKKKLSFVATTLNQ